jgi:hypothetical protein
VTVTPSPAEYFLSPGTVAGRGLGPAPNLKHSELRLPRSRWPGHCQWRHWQPSEARVPAARARRIGPGGPNLAPLTVPVTEAAGPGPAGCQWPPGPHNAASAAGGRGGHL